PDRLHRLQGAHLAVRVHDADRHRVRTDGAAHVVWIDHAEFVDPYDGEIEALCLEGTRRPEHRVVLDLRGDDVSLAAGAGQAFDREVVGLGAAGREHDLLGRHAEEAGHALARPVHPLAGLAPEGVDARGIAEDLAEIWQHLGEHLRVHGGRRVVIQVDSTAHRLALHFSRCYARLRWRRRSKSSACSSRPASSIPISKPPWASPTPRSTAASSRTPTLLT